MSRHIHCKCQVTTMEGETPGEADKPNNNQASTKMKRKASDAPDGPQYIDLEFMYNYMKSVETQLGELRDENKKLHDRLTAMESTMAQDVASAVKRGIAEYFDQNACKVPLPTSPSPSLEFMDSETSTASPGMRNDKLNYSKAVTSQQNSVPSSRKSQPLVTTNVSLTPPKSTKFQHQTPLNPACSVVLYNIPVSKKSVITKDRVRETINKVIGPTLILSVNKYHFDSELPKYMVQFKSEEKVQSLLEKWTESTLDSVKVRPAKSPEKNVGMLPHVPLDLNLSAIQEDLDKIFPGSVCTRIEKNHAPTRTVKVVFKDKKFLEDALEKGIKSSNLQSIWLVQLPHSTPKFKTT